NAAVGARSVIVIGGGFIGLEMAENLRRRGLEVDLVEMLDQVMPPLDKEMTVPVIGVLHLHGIRMHLSDAVSAFDDDAGRVVARLKSGKSLSADLVILSIGVRPESQLAKAAGLAVNERGGIVVDELLRTSDPDIFAAGDAVVVRDVVTQTDSMIPLAGPANRQGRIAAENALGRSSRYRGSQGTSIVRVFNLVVAMTGASEKTLNRTGKSFEKVYLHPSNHATYFPGSTKMSIKLLFSPEDGRILGSQIVGRDGVDTRINVVATAIQSGMTVYDLEELELAYAPQFGSAKDPLNMAGFIAANILRGDVKQVHADALGDGLLLDVRTSEEHDAGAIPDSLHIPIDSLRNRMSELPKDSPIIT
ncbi:MAG: FAD-dependent oxidoreductase, partial [Chloroflexota bacterium]